MPKPTKELISRMSKIGFITVEKASKLADVGGSAISRWANKKEVESLKHGTYLFVSKPDIMNLLPKIPARKAFAMSMKEGKRTIEKSDLASPIGVSSFKKNLLDALRDPLIQKEFKRLVKSGVTDYALQKGLKNGKSAERYIVG